eukprot:2938572-Pyramimonas_sp.AAC.1
MLLWPAIARRDRAYSVRSLGTIRLQRLAATTGMAIEAVRGSNGKARVPARFLAPGPHDPSG